MNQNRIEKIGTRGYRRLIMWICYNFTGIGRSIEDCTYRTKWGMKEHITLLKEKGLPVPPENPNPKIVIQNEGKLAIA